MNYIIYDLEATCWETKTTDKVQEVIEIGAIMLDENARIVDRFESFIRPKINPLLSKFCTKLTSISQIDVNRADFFPDVADDFKEWIGWYDEEDYLLCSWGFFDQLALAKDCKLHDMDDEWTKPHISLKHQYQAFRGLPKPIGLKKAVEIEGFEFTGTHHRGIDDAENLAKIFIKYFNLWEHGKE